MLGTGLRVQGLLDALISNFQMAYSGADPGFLDGEFLVTTPILHFACVKLHARIFYTRPSAILMRAIRQS